jgi:hypothetical protein
MRSLNQARLLNEQDGMQRERETVKLVHDGWGQSMIRTVWKDGHPRLRINRYYQYWQWIRVGLYKLHALWFLAAHCRNSLSEETKSTLPGARVFR